MSKQTAAPRGSDEGPVIMQFQKMQWLFPIAVTLHSVEEAVFMPTWVAEHRSQLPLHPVAARVRFGLLLLTLAAFAVTYLSVQKGKQSIWAYLLFGYAVAMLLNVFIPHVPATLFFGGYTLGVVTAVLINLPLMSILLFKALREQWVSGTKAIAHAALVPLAIATAISALFAFFS